MDGPLVDAQQFPRADIDVRVVREARHRIICKCQSDESCYFIASANERCSEPCLIIAVLMPLHLTWNTCEKIKLWGNSTNLPRDA